MKYERREIPKFRDPISMFDTSTHTTVNGKFYDQQDLTQQYQNIAQICKPDEFVFVVYECTDLKHNAVL